MFAKAVSNLRICLISIVASLPGFVGGSSVSAQPSPPSIQIFGLAKFAASDAVHPALRRIVEHWTTHGEMALTEIGQISAFLIMRSDDPELNVGGHVSASVPKGGAPVQHFYRVEFAAPRVIDAVSIWDATVHRDHVPPNHRKAVSSDFIGAYRLKLKLVDSRTRTYNLIAWERISEAI
jgi:hypothetical protein